MRVRVGFVLFILLLVIFSVELGYDKSLVNICLVDEKFIKVLLDFGRIFF